MQEETFTGNEMPDAMVDAMFSDATPPSPEPVAAEATAVDTETETGQVAEPEAAEAIKETEEPVADAAPAEPPVEGDELPEGVTVRDRNGKKEWVYPEERGRLMHAGYRLAKDAEGVIGEPLSLESLADRQVSHDWFHGQRVDSISSDPQDQAHVFRNIFQEAAKAISNGEIGHDPLETMGEAFLGTLREMAPEHYERATAAVLNERIQALYQDAARTGNEKLLRTAQNLDHVINGKYVDDADVKKLATKPVDDREQRLAKREQDIARHDQRAKEQAFQSWHGDTKAAIHDAVGAVLRSQIPDAISKAISATPDGAKRLEGTIKLLDIEVREAIKSDQNWLRQNADLFKLARMAPSEQRREAIQKQITQRYEQKARQVVAVKGPAIISAQSIGVKSANTATHAKLRDGASQTGSPVPGKPASRSIPNALPANVTWEQYVDSI